MAGQAQTGTGKTAAFLIATFNRLLGKEDRPWRRGNSPGALIIAPTRELVIQIKEEAELLGKHCGLDLHAVYGGVDYQKQLDRLKEGVDVLVGTPGRLIDYFRQRAYRLDATEILVIDEADRMFDMGFIDDVRYLATKLPKPTERQSFLYSATLSQRVLELGYEHMNDVERVAVSEEKVTADNITQVVYHVGQHEKLPLLLGLLDQEAPTRALIFVNTRSIAAELADRLEQEGHSAGALAGDIDQRKRMKVLGRLKDGTLKVLVATDVASRGLHIENVSHVINYDLPQDPEDYVHRIGRTARAGASGKAVSLACEKYVYSLEAIEEFIDSKLPHEFPDESMLIKPISRRPPRRSSRGQRPERGGGGRGGGGRGSGGRGGGGRGGGGRGSGSGSGGGGGGDRGARGDGGAHGDGGATATAGAPAAQPAGEEGQGKSRRRSRRRRKKSTTAPAATTPD